jgi:hypothetical protein
MLEPFMAADLTQLLADNFDPFDPLAFLPAAPPGGNDIVVSDNATNELALEQSMNDRDFSWSDSDPVLDAFLNETGLNTIESFDLPQEINSHAPLHSTNDTVVIQSKDDVSSTSTELERFINLNPNKRAVIPPRAPRWYSIRTPK